MSCDSRTRQAARRELLKRIANTKHRPFPAAFVFRASFSHRDALCVSLTLASGGKKRPSGARHCCGLEGAPKFLPP